MAVTTNNYQLDVIKFNIEVLKFKNFIDEKSFSKTIKEELTNYLFKLDENNDFQLNDLLIKHTFSKYDVLEVIVNYLNEIDGMDNINLIKEGLNNKLDDVYFNMDFPDLNPTNFKNNLNNYEIQEYQFNEYEIDSLISHISLDEFNQQDNGSDLIYELNDLIQIPIFKYFTSGLDELEVSKVLNKIKEDVNSNLINGDISYIIEYYFDTYKLFKNQSLLNHFLDEYIGTPSFFEISKGFDDETAIGIIDKVRNEIYQDKTMDNNKIILKLKDYFKKEIIKRQYLDELEKCRQKIHELSENYNLTIDEMEDIFNQTTTELEDNKVDGSLYDHLSYKFVLKIESNQSESRLKLNNLLKNDKLREELDFNESDLDIVSDEIGELIYNNKIRSHEITEELIIEKLKETANGI